MYLHEQDQKRGLPLYQQGVLQVSYGKHEPTISDLSVDLWPSSNQIASVISGHIELQVCQHQHINMINW